LLELIKLANTENDEYFAVELDCIAVKGKKEGVNIYTVFRNPDAGAMVEWIMARDEHNTMLQAYRLQQWDRAVEMVNALKGEFDGNMDHYYDLWLERIEEMRNAGLPKDWDGEFRATSK
jgi:adenylate cyclase